MATRVVVALRVLPVSVFLVLQSEQVMSHLVDPEVRARLLPLLPEGQQTDANLYEIVRYRDVA